MVFRCWRYDVVAAWVVFRFSAFDDLCETEIYIYLFSCRVLYCFRYIADQRENRERNELLFDLFDERILWNVMYLDTSNCEYGF